MAWRRPGDKRLSESMMVSLHPHICVARSQCISVLCVYLNILKPRKIWTPFCTILSPINFLNENFRFRIRLIDVTSLWSNWQYLCIGSVNGLAQATLVVGLHGISTNVNCNPDTLAVKKQSCLVCYCPTYQRLPTLITRFMGPTWGPWGRQDPGGPHVGPMNFAIWLILCEITTKPATQICLHPVLMMYRPYAVTSLPVFCESFVWRNLASW